MTVKSDMTLGPGCSSYKFDISFKKLEAGILAICSQSAKVGLNIATTLSITALSIRAYFTTLNTNDNQHK
jgi:hypothetical protein